jgi:hypothetical protein
VTNFPEKILLKIFSGMKSSGMCKIQGRSVTRYTEIAGSEEKINRNKNLLTASDDQGTGLAVHGIQLQIHRTGQGQRDPSR